MARRVTLVLCSPAGRVLGTLPPFDVSSPWWPDVGPVVTGALERFGVRLTVLRVLRTTGRGPDGGEGAYLAETPDAGPVALGEPDDDLRSLAESEDPLRQPWARLGGIAADVAWADEQLDAAGRPRTAPAEQVKSWNLSGVLRLPTAGAPVWCKHVPRFLAHESAVLELLGRAEPGLVPTVIAAQRDDGGSSVALLENVPGDEQWEAPEPVLAEMARRWVGVQARRAGDVDRLLALGVPDRRSASLAALVARLTARPDVRATLPATDLEQVDAVVADLPARLAAIDACGLPDTLVHGDLHPGNWIGGGGRLVLVDWGDSVVGQPMLDVLAFLERIADEAVRARVRDVFVDTWRRHRPSSDPERAIELAWRVESLRRAAVYREFLDGIEETERDYHECDVPDMLRRAVAAA